MVVIKFWNPFTLINIVGVSYYLNILKILQPKEDCVEKGLIKKNKKKKKKKKKIFNVWNFIKNISRLCYMYIGERFLNLFG